MPTWDRRQWNPPPEDVRALVADALGPAFWPRLEQTWARALALDPSLKATQWYRSPSELVAEKRRQPTKAGLYSQHGLGLAVDITPANAQRQAIADLFKRSGLFVRTYGRGDAHLHVAALSDAAWSASPLLKYLRQRVGPYLAR